MTRKLTAAFLSLSLPFLLSGCTFSSANSIYSNFKSIENIQLSESMGFDAGENGATAVSFCLRPSDKELSPARPTVVGNTISAAIMDATGRIPKVDLYLAHANCVVLGEPYARRGVEEFVDFVQRDVDVRGGSNLFIVRDNTAQALFSGTSDTNFTISDDLNALKKLVEHSGIGKVSTIIAMSRGLAERGVALVYSITLSDKGGGIMTKGSESVALPGGYCVLIDGKLAGFLDGDATRGVCVVQSCASNSTDTLMVNGANVTVQLLDVRTRLRPVWDGDKLAELKINVKTIGMVLEMDKMLPLGDKNVQRAINDAAAKTIASQITAAINASRNLGADFLDFSSLIDDRNPVKFSKLREHWPEYWQTLPITITVDVEIDKYSDMGGPQSYRGGR